MPKTALIAGASGLIGQQLLPLLLASARYSRVIALVRTPLPMVHEKLEQLVVDFERLADYRQQLVADDVFCCLGTTMRQAGSREAFYKVDFTYVVELAKLAATNFGGQLLVVSSLGADARARAYYLRVKGEMEEAVRQTTFHAVHIFRPSLLLGHRATPHPNERLATALLAVLKPLLRGPLRPYRAIAADTVARAMLRAAEDDGGGIRIHPSDAIAREGGARISAG
ncbi:NAD-dependent epimerase/dehydratase family protein [Hymenobacter lapidiphilus]|uniref:NAD(P)H-binding protein n=1 Tax=Hymenobacter sp. CCM 8763 TaxID=2303334 RepID=UPI000E3503AC|nr:NAD(P)H-binding protein [Hymenobacter sp. CCM 8763]RFP66919.1 NAD-dependent epimerase/dehydratase family protein [Hymenobacter sp. CCM 8763]